MKKIIPFIFALLATFSCTKTIDIYPELPTIQLQTPTQSTFQESLAETATFAVILSQEVSEDQIININFSGTATKDVDYTVLTPMPLVIKKGEKSASIQVKILKDNTYESGSENIIASLNNLSNKVKLGSSPLVEMTIYDGKALISFETASKNYVENQSSDEAVTIKLDKAIDEDIVVYINSSSTNSYYSLTSASKALIIPAGSTSAIAYVDTYDSRINSAADSKLTLTILSVKNNNVSISSTLNQHVMNIADYQSGLSFTTNWSSSYVDMDMYVKDANGYTVTSTYSANDPLALSQFEADGTYYFYLNYYTSYFYPNVSTIVVKNTITNAAVGTYTFTHTNTSDLNVLKIVKSGTTFTVTQIATTN